jgi:signal transduction histidine kinase
MAWKAACLALALWALGFPARAEAPVLGSPVITNYEPKHYKAHGQNWVAVQDARGVLYFGNTHGILEFDGQRWRLIPVPGESIVRGLALGPGGRVYYGSVGELGYLAPTPSGAMAAVSLKEALPKGEQDFNEIWQVASCADGVYFLAADRLFRFHDGRFTVLPGKFASSQACVLDGALFFTDVDRGICLVDGDRTLPIPGLKGVADGSRSVLAPYGPRQLLVGRLSGSFRLVNLTPLWDPARGRFDPARPVAGSLARPFPTDVDAFLGPEQALLYKLVPLGDQGFAITTLKAGVLLFDRQGRFLRSIDKAGGLLDNTVGDVLVDRTGDLWASNNSGISHVELSVPQSIFDARNGLDDVSISVHAYQGRLYVGTFQGLFVQAPYHYRLKDSLPRFVPLKGAPSEVWAFQEAGGDLLAATGRGLYRIEGETAQRIPGSALHSQCLAISSRWPEHLFVGQKGRVLAFRRTGHQWTYLGRLRGIEDNVHGIATDPQGDLWLTTEVHGVVRVHFVGASPMEVATRRLDQTQGLPSLQALDITCQGATLHATTPAGLFRADVTPWREEAADSTRFALDRNLGRAFCDPPTHLIAMVPDGRGGYFFRTEHGITWAVPGGDGQFRLDPRPLEGILSTTDTFYPHPDGSVWIPGKALYRVEPWARKSYDQPFDALIRKVATRSRRVLLDGEPASPGGLPVLPFRDNALTFEFAAPFYEKPGTTQFQYLLEGQDRTWSEWAQEPLKEFTNLPEGRYRFRVRARNLYGAVSREAAYAFRISPPWYRTPWAFALWILSGGLGLAGIVYLYTLKLRRQKERLERQVGLRTAELSAVNERLYQLNDEKNRIIGVAAHDLRNPLSGIVLSCDLMDDGLEGEEDADPAALSARIRTQCRKMLDLIQGLLDVNAIEANTAELPIIESLDPVPPIETACKAHRIHAQRKGIAIDLDLDGRHFERIMDNLVSNAVKYSPGGTRITLSRESGEGHTTFRVKDQGPGLSEEDQQHLFQTYARLSARPTGGEASVGLGLFIVKKLVDGMGGQVWVDSIPGEGATFSVRFPNATERPTS